MLIRQGGGWDDIKEYLENGIKDGCAIHRDIKDKRIVLDGDLDITNLIIKNIESEGERYSHYTLSFKEDFVPMSKLIKTVKEFKKFFGAAYNDDEYCFYAEAHLPKIKTFIDQKTGETIKRKPHIHIVTPKRNIITGEYLRPLGYYDHNVKYVEAIQELLNIELSLESPKDNRRSGLVDFSDIISRYKGDLFNSDSKKTKERIINKVLEKNVSDINSLKNILLEFGDVKIRNKGKDNEYFNVLPIGNKKGINLKDFVFSKYFIELSHNDKLSVISGVDRKNKPRNLELEKEKYKSILDEWYKLRCHEIRYLHPSSKAWKKYKDESSDNKRVIISNYISENNKLRKEYLTSTFGNKRNEEKYNLSSLIKYTHQNRINNEQISFSDSKPLSRKRCGPPPSRRNKLLHLSECDVVYLSRERTEMLLPDDVFDQLSTGRKKRATKWNNNVRWDVHQEGVTVPARYSDNVTNEILKDIAGKKFSSTKTETVDWKLFNHSIDHEAFLDMLSVTHGITRSAYIVTQGRDGSPRIQCGRLKRSINDFLTKELHLEWPEAQDILINERKRQQENNLIKPKLDKSYSYWKEFKNWQSLEGNSYKELWADLRGNHKRQIHAHREQFHLRRRSIYSNTSISWRERRAQLSLLRIEKLACEEKLRLNFKRQKEELKESLLIEVRYLEFLKTKIKSGDKEALAEYRCFAREINKKHINSNGINTLESNNAVLEGYKFTVGTSGNVIYTIKDTEAIEDTPLWVSVIQDEDKDVIELAVRLALEKNYGKPLEITGNESFQQRVVQVVIERGIRADFKDENLDLYRRQYEAAKRKSDDLNHYSINKKQKSKKFNKN